MGRKERNNADYFPHRCGMINHRKVKVLRNKFGDCKAYAFWARMLEWLTECDGLEWEYTEKEREMFASDLGISAAEIKEMVDFCVRFEMLFLTESNFIYSESLNEELKPVFDKRRREKDKSEARKRREKTDICNSKHTSEGISAAEIPQSRVEKSIEDNTKEKKEKKKRVSPLFSPPLLSDVENFVIEKFDLSQTAAAKFSEKFVGYYGPAEWKLSTGSKMKSWQQSVSGQWRKTVMEMAEQYPKEVVAETTGLSEEILFERKRRQSKYENSIRGFPERAGDKFEFMEEISVYHVVKGRFDELRK